MRDTLGQYRFFGILGRFDLWEDWQEVRDREQLVSGRRRRCHTLRVPA